MKKQFVSNSTRTVFTRLGFAFLLFVTLQSFAYPATEGEDPTIQIKYVGSVDERIRFQVDLANANEEAYLFSIQDEDGYVFYREKVDKKNYMKKFEWNKEDFNSTKLLFIVTRLKSKKSQLYEVNTYSRTTQEVFITKR